jgi:hypothetical protein
LSHEELNGPLDSAVKRQSTEITTLLGSSTLLRSSSVDLGWKNFVIERHTILASEKPEAKLKHHFLILWDVRVAEGESAYHSGQFSPYKKYPNTITACLPGIRPAVRSRFDHEVIVGALHPHIVERPRPSSTWISNASVFQIPGGHTFGGQRCAQVTRMLEIVLVAPEAAVDVHHDRVRSVALWKAQITELVRVRAIGHPFVSRRRGQTQNVVAGHGKILLTGHVVRCFPIHVWASPMEHIVPDVVFERARAHFNEQELIAIVFTLTTINAWNRLAITMRTEVGNYGLLRDLALFILLGLCPALAIAMLPTYH